MRAVKYNKLVRDKIPEMIAVLGASSDIELVSGEKLLKTVDETIDMTLAGYHEKQSVQELIDLVELIYVAAEARGYTADQFDSWRLNARKDYGGYDKGFELTVVYENDE